MYPAFMSVVFGSKNLILNLFYFIEAGVHKYW